MINPKEIVAGTTKRGKEELFTLPSNICCTYFLFYKKRLVYVGFSENLINRLKQHEKNKFFTHFSFIESDRSAALNLESRCIKILKPVYNRNKELKAERTYNINSLTELRIKVSGHHIPIAHMCRTTRRYVSDILNNSDERGASEETKLAVINAALQVSIRTDMIYINKEGK